MDILVSFLILKETLSAFHNCIWCCLYVCHIWSLLCRGVFPLYPLCWKFLILSGYCCFSVAQLYPTRPFATPWTAAHQVSLSITNFRSFLKLMSVESMIPSNYLILQCHCLCLPSVFPSIRVFSNESEWILNNSKNFSHIFWDDHMIFILKCVNVVYCVDINRFVVSMQLTSSSTWQGF